jgi:hypothetical protein
MILKDKKDSKTGIPHNYQDLLLKNLTDNGLDEFLKVFALDFKDLKPIRNENNLIQISQYVMDRAFQCPDGSIVDFEFDSTGKLADLVRYVEYAFLLFINNVKQREIIAPVNIFVFYPASVTIPKLDNLFIGNKIFTIRQIPISQYINGPELITSLNGIITSGVNPFHIPENRVKLSLSYLRPGQRKTPRLLPRRRQAGPTISF